MEETAHTMKEGGENFDWNSRRECKVLSKKKKDWELFQKCPYTKKKSCKAQMKRICSDQLEEKELSNTSSKCENIQWFH